MKKILFLISLIAVLAACERPEFGTENTGPERLPLDALASVEQGDVFLNSFREIVISGYKDNKLQFLKIDRTGNEIINHKYDLGLVNNPGCMVETQSGEYLFAYTAYKNFEERKEFYLTKLNSVGDTLWTREFGGSDYDEVVDLLSTKEGDFLLLCNSSRFHEDTIPEGALDIWNYVSGYYLLKVDDAGTPLWSKLIPEYDFSVSPQIVLLNNGDIQLFGDGHNPGFNPRGLIMIRFDQYGNPLWENYYPDLDCPLSRRLIELENGNLLVTGYALEAEDIRLGFLSEIGGNGEYHWKSDLRDGKINLLPSAILKLEENEFIVGGYCYKNKKGEIDYFVGKYDATGQELWIYRYGGSGNEFVSGIFADNNGDLMIVGTVRDPEVTNPYLGNSFFIRLNPDGTF